MYDGKLFALSLQIPADAFAQYNNKGGEKYITAML